MKGLSPDAAAILGVSDTSVRNLVWAGRLPGHRLGRSIKVRPEEVEAYAEALQRLR
jgi:excisionase family DNA binding protein